MKKDIFLLLGGNPLNLGILQKFKQKGYQVFVVDWNEHPALTGDKHYRIDVKDFSAILSALEQDGVLPRVAFAYSSIDLAVGSVARLNRAVGLQTISDEGLKYASSKSEMTRRWQEQGLLNRISEKHTAFNEQILALNRQYKIIIKPDNSASSRGITVVEQNSPNEIVRQAFAKAQQEATNHLVVVEEFVEGTEFTVEMIGDGQGAVCVFGVSKKTHTRHTDHNKIAVKLHYNAVDMDLQNRIAAYGIKCYKALGFSSSLGHLEVLVKPDGTISPVEIGARSSGFIASNLVDSVSGVDFLGTLLEVQRGQTVQEGLHPQTENSSMYFFYDFPDRFTIKKTCCLADFLAPQVKILYSDRRCLALGHTFHNIDNDNARVGFEILEGPKDLLTPAYVAQQEAEMLQAMRNG